MTFKRGLTLSSLIHLALLIALVLPYIKSGDGTNTEPQPAGSTEKTGDIIPKESEEEQKEIVVELVDLPKKKAQPAKGHECKGDNWYGGIGVVHNGHKISEVAVGYPAYRAGVRVGDETISNIDVIRGEPGTSMNLVVIRDGVMLYFEMVREKICLEDIK